MLRRDLWLGMLDRFGEAGFTVLRLGESAWGHLEPAPGDYRLDWLARAVDDIAGRGMGAILGTNTYIAPQWLLERHPDARAEMVPGMPTHPMYRKAASLAHPAYREACRGLVAALGARFAGHGAVIGWQLDNEIDASSMMGPDHSAAARAAWTAWLRARFGTVERMNERLGLHSWGMMVRSFEAVEQPRDTFTESVYSQLPALKLAGIRFRRDLIAGFLREQAEGLRAAGATGWIMTNWMTNWLTPADDPALAGVLDVAGLNVYPIGDRQRFWEGHAWHLDLARSAGGAGRFLVTATRIGVTGTTAMFDAFPSRAEWRLWMLLMVAFGADALIYWSGHRWHGGHWPRWGGLLDWRGEPEPDAPWVAELGAFLGRHGERLLAAPVRADAAVLTDLDGRAALQCYPHMPGSAEVLRGAFGLFHRLGVGVDAVTPAAVLDGALARYRVVVVAAAPALDDPALAEALRDFAAGGGVIVVGPFSAYQEADGRFAAQGPGALLEGLCGARIRSIRRLGAAGEPGYGTLLARWADGAESPVAVEGYVELLEPRGAAVEARLAHPEPIYAPFALATRREVGRGVVLRLGFWPGDDAVLHRLGRELARRGVAVHGPFPPGVRAVPRADGSLFVANSGGESAAATPAGPWVDLIDGADPAAPLPPFGIRWLAPAEPGYT